MATGHQLRLLAGSVALLGSAVLAGCQKGPAAHEAVAAPSVVSQALPLHPGALPERHLTAGAVHRYQFEMPAGRYAELVIEQRGVDVAVRLFDPRGRLRRVVDGTNGALGPEPLPVLAEPPGSWQVEVTAAGAGGYSLAVLAVRPAADRDRRRVTAEDLFAFAEGLRRREDAAAKARALDLIRRARTGFAAAGAPSREGDALDRLGRLHSERGEAGPAIAAWQEALRRFADPSAPDRRAARDVLNMLGSAWLSLGRPDDAVACYRRALALSAAVGREPVAEGKIWNNLGAVHAGRGEAEAAFRSYDRALGLWRAVGDRGEEGVTLANLGRLYARLGEPERGRDLLARAVARLEEARRPRDTANVLTDLGLLHGGSAALPFLERALALHRRLGNRRGEAVALASLGLVQVRLGDWPRARDLFARARPLFEALGDRPETAATLANLAQAEAALGRPRRAIALNRQALALLEAAGDRPRAASVRVRLAWAWRQAGDLAAARAALAPALDAVEELRREPAGGDLRATFLASRQEVYDLGVELLLALDAREPSRGHALAALELAEQAKARSLIDALDAGDGGRRGLPPALLARETAAERRLNAAALERLRLALEEGEEAPEPRRRAAETALLARLYERERVEAEVRRAAPDRRPPLPPLRAAEIQALLDRDTVLLEYALGAERSALWVVSRERIEVHPLPPRADLETAARAAHRLLAAEQRTLVRERSTAALAKLSRLLLGPVVESLGLEGSLAGRRILVVPDGALAYVPFAALPGADARPLLTHHEVVALPSATTLAVLRRAVAGRPPAPRRLAVLADPVLTAADPRLAGRTGPTAAGASEGDGGEAPAVRALVRSAAGWLTRLPATGAETDALLALVPPRERLAARGFAASRTTVESGALADYRILHFATHGLIDAEHPALSGLVLSLFDEAGRPRDGFLRVHQIHRLHLPADLVVLSACRTALGREVRGEGLVGLTQAFFHAGARRVVVSLWPVDDRATAELMAGFYRALLRDGQPPAAALRTAQLALLSRPERHDPFYWAGFVLMGDWR